MSNATAPGTSPRRRLIEDLRRRTAAAELREIPRLESRLERLGRTRLEEAEFLRRLAAVEREVDRSIERVAARRAAPVALEFDPKLPITAHRDEIVTALEKHQVLIVCGETGSGKSTQLPKLCLAAGRGTAGLIGHTQPRRIAARAIADRLATELGVALGAEVGYQVRFTDRTGPRARVKLMTDGILLRELEHDRELRRYDTLIIDEAHERSLNVDFLLGYLHRIAARRPDLRVVITSATIDTDRFSQFFAGAPVINVSGRSYPVEVRYRPLEATDDGDSDERTLIDGVTDAVAELVDSGGSRGDILVFLPGERQIRASAIALDRRGPRSIEILPLFARQSAAEQARVFAPHSAQRVILATNVAETSLTVPGVRYVVDSGLARISRYSPRIRVQRLPVEPVSQASADQRKGRCGREAPGVCIRLYSEESYAEREAQTPPEILRTNLASVILQMAALGLGDPENFPFIDAPDTRLIGDGYRLLEELSAVDSERRVTRVGRDMAALPVDPRLARMLIAAGREGCLSEMLVLAAFLSIQDPRERSDDRVTREESSPDATSVTEDARSDFVSVLNLWKAYHEVAPEVSRSALRRWCKARSLAFLRMREWEDLVGQLTQAVADVGLKQAARPATYQQLHRAILSGLLGQVGQREERREYAGARSLRFVIAPGTPLAQRPPRWVVAGSLIETARVYARMVAAVEPAWIEAAAGPLVKRTCSEPHWLPARGYVAAFETARLFGLVLSARRRVNYGTVDAADAQRIFVMHALVLRESRIEAKFLRENAALQREIEQIEARLRRRDVLVDEGARAEFYRQRMPQRVSSVAAFEHWRREAERAEPRLLFMSRSDLMAREVDPAELAGFPSTFNSGSNEFPLQYRFEPGAEDDGVSMVVPVEFLAALDAGQLAWLVPGLRHEKVVAVFRGLPKSVRRRLVPVPDFARVALAGISSEGDFFEELARWLNQTTGESVSAAALAAVPVPEHLQMNLRVVDASGQTLAMGRSLASVRRRTLSDSGTSRTLSGNGAEVHRRWSFGALPEQIEIERGDLKLIVYPGLEDAGTGVRRVEFATASSSREGLRQGVRRLAMLALPQQFKYARKAFADRRELVLLGSVLVTSRPLPELLAERVFRECFDPDGLEPPRSEAEFALRLDERRGLLGEKIDEVAGRVERILRELHGVRQRLGELAAPAFEPTVADVETQLRGLFPDDFPLPLREQRFANLPRYVQAIARRLAKVRSAVERDRRAVAQLTPHLATYASLEQKSQGQGLAPPPALLTFADMIEEFRVSLFAQELGTAMPVSGKRLDAQAEQARAALRSG